MQDKYVGDIGDFGKYILLNAVFDECKVRCWKLGINWYRFNDSKKSKDGKFIGYLCPITENSNKYENCNEGLFKQLKQIVRSNKRSITEIMSRSVLPTNLFYPDPLPDPDTEVSKREAARGDWFAGSLTSPLRDAGMIFLDPDNGIVPRDVKKTHTNAGKYVFPDEIETYFKSEKSLIIYQHKDWMTPDTCFQQELFSKVRCLLPGAQYIKLLRFNPFSVRYYVFILHGDHKKVAEKAIQSLINVKLPCTEREYMFCEVKEGSTM